VKETVMIEFRTLPQIFIDQVKNRGDHSFLYYKEEGTWKSVSWNEVAQKVKHLSLGLITLGVKNGDRVSAISETRPEMAYYCLAISASGAIFTPIYHTNSPKECAHVINDSGVEIVIAEDQNQLEKLKTAWPLCPNLKRIIVFKPTKPIDDPRIMTLDQLYDLGKEALKKHGDGPYYERIASVQPDDICSIIYTSGTTGPPKGVMDTNRGTIRCLTEFTRFFPMSEKDKGMGFLPMAHGIELRNHHWCHILYGFPLAYAESIQKIFENVHETEPTFLFTTPRFFEKHYNNLTAMIEAAPPWKKRLYDWSLKVGADYQDMKEGGRVGIAAAIRNAIADRILFQRVHATVGRKIQWSNCGGAPMPHKILRFFRACGFYIFEGYGLTEATGLLSSNRPGAWKIGTVGKPSDGLVLTITEDGEILSKGWSMSAGYWNNPEATAELFRDGQVHTGDMGFLDEDGFLHITGRKKEILITSSGKNITPGNIQNMLKMSPYISEALVLGEGETFLTALVTLDEEQTSKYAAEHNIKYSSFAELTRRPEIVALIGKETATVNQDLARIEQVKDFTILEDQFRQDRDELTPTMKVKRRVIEERYKDKIRAMYLRK
jgi:long-chain acyl-CoA synthetase